LIIDLEFLVVAAVLLNDYFTPNLKLSVIRKILSSSLPLCMSFAMEWFNKFLFGLFLYFYLDVKG
jgi:hypothetical protein